VSVHFKFDYRKFPSDPSEAFPRRHSANRPAIPITLINGSNRIRYLALIDSGADLCIFHAEIGEQIGIDIESGKKLEFNGITGEKMLAFFHHVEVEVGGYRLPCYAGFCKELTKMPYGILGHQGFFDTFQVTFDYDKEKIELRLKG
jgi:hypothetical protein